MVKFTNFCGIFATVFMVATAITIVSCSQDDDDYNSDMYTLAEKMETRSGGDPGENPIPSPKSFQAFVTKTGQEIKIGYNPDIWGKCDINLTYTSNSLFTSLTCEANDPENIYTFQATVSDTVLSETNIHFKLQLIPYRNGVSGQALIYPGESLKKSDFQWR